MTTITAREAEALSGLSKEWVYTKAKEGAFKTRKSGYTLLIDKASFLSWVKNRSTKRGNRRATVYCYPCIDNRRAFLPQDRTKYWRAYRGYKRPMVCRRCGAKVTSGWRVKDE